VTGEHRGRRLAVLLATLLLLGLGACSDDDAGGNDGTGQRSDGETDGGQDDAPGEGDDGEGGDDEPDEPEVELLEPADLPAEAVPFADALRETFATQGAFTSATPAEADCLATNIVAIVGAERFAAAGITPEAFAANPDLAPTGIDRAEAEQLYDVFAGCGLDYAAATIEGMALETADPAAARACLEDVLDEAVVREMAVSALLGIVDESPEVDEAIAAMTACTAPDEG
jgi:hypothetical protein